MASISPLHGGLVWKNQQRKTQLNSADFPFLRGAQTETKEQEKKSETSDLNSQFDPQPSSLPIEERVKLILSVGEKTYLQEEVLPLLKRKPLFNCYDGFEPSGRMHIAQGILKAINVNKMTRAGGIFIFWVADWFAVMNNKMNGDMGKIRKLGEYFIEIWKAAGMDLRNVKFLWTAEEISKQPDKYWSMVIDIARRNTLNRIRRCCKIMGRDDDEELSPAQIMYPCMQCTDIFFLKADICQLGMDQLKVNVLAREYCDVRKDLEKPIIVSHHMLMGLKKDQEKMSKSDPDSAIFMEDDADAVYKKIAKKAFCEPGDIFTNPILDYTKHIIFQTFPEFVVKRAPENGGDAVYKNYEELEDDFKNLKLHPGDLKPAVAEYINRLLEPVRQHFKRDPKARALLEEIRSWG